MTILPTSTLGDLVADVPARGAVLDRLGLDYCCHGQRSLADACADAGLEVAEVAGQLAAASAATEAAGGVAGEGLSYPTEPAALTEYIEATHHQYLHAELPELFSLATKVAEVHGSRHPELGEVRKLVGELGGEMVPHMLKEEHVLFPAIRALAAGARDFPFGTVRNPVRMMLVDHDRAGELLASLRAVTNGYEVPADGCASYHALYERLAVVEADTHVHIHLENNVLFPAAIAVEDGAAA